MGKTKRHTHKKAKKAQTHKKKAHTHTTKKHTGRKHRRNHTRKMSGGGVLRRILRKRKDEKRRKKEIQEAATAKGPIEYNKPEFSPRPRLPPTVYNVAVHQKHGTKPPSYASIASNSNPHYAIAGPPPKVSYDRVKGDSSTPYENVSSRSRSRSKSRSKSMSKLVPNPEVKKNRRVIFGNDGRTYQEENF